MAGRTTRRGILAAALLAGCGHKRAPRYSGWLFIASAGEQGIAVGDLAEFRRVTTIALPQTPRQILRAGGKVFATCPEARTICEIDPARFTLAGRVNLPGRMVASAVTPNGRALVTASDQPAALHIVSTATRRVVRTVALPDAPLAMDVSDEMAVLTMTGNSVTRVSLGDGKVAGSTALGLRGGIVRFGQKGNSILVGAADRNLIVSLDTATGAVLARLPVAFLPTRFCFSADEGQMFVTGSGEDSIIIVSPYQSEVDQTMIAGHRPYGMAVAEVQGRNLLFVTNAGSGNLTVFDIDTRGLASSIHVGGNPGEVLITPDGGYALVIDRQSGDVSVVRISVALNRSGSSAQGQGAKPLFTVFPTGAGPQSAAIIPVV